MTQIDESNAWGKYDIIINDYTCDYGSSFSNSTQNESTSYSRVTKLIRKKYKIDCNIFYHKSQLHANIRIDRKLVTKPNRQKSVCRGIINVILCKSR